MFLKFPFKSEMAYYGQVCNCECNRMGENILMSQIVCFYVNFFGMWCQFFVISLLDLALTLDDNQSVMSNFHYQLSFIWSSLILYTHNINNVPNLCTFKPLVHEVKLKVYTLKDILYILFSLSLQHYLTVMFTWGFITFWSRGAAIGE